MRKVGLEIELGGISLQRTLDLLQSSLGGTVEVQSRTEGALHDTAFGKFKVELDSKPLKERRYMHVLEQLGMEPDSSTAQLVEESVLQVASELVPIEIVTPPIPIDRLHELDPLWSSLRSAGAEDTHSSVLNAFGLHLNPEMPDGETATLLGVMRAFLLLEDWIMDASRIDISRRIAPYIRPFPEAYRRMILQPDYAPDAAGLVRDYLTHSPTRNRPVDLLPLFVHLHGEALLKSVSDAPLVKARPTYHYRLPNCELATPNWSPARDWNRWVAVEKLAENPELLTELSVSYLETFDLPLRLQSGGWLDSVRARLSLPGEDSQKSVA